MRSATLALVVLAALLLSRVAPAADVHGTAFPDAVSITSDGPPLLLNGAGERRILLFRVYAIGLYLPRPARTLDEVIAMHGPKRMHMIMLRNDITARQVHDHVVARIEDGTQPAEMAQMRARLAELDRIIDAERVINKGGTITLDWLPGAGTIIRVNGIVKGEPIPGEDFYNALLRIWLGDKAKSLALRDQLLGRATG
jgi:hypothetical protein